MSEADKARWDQRYRDGAYSTRHAPNVLLTQWAQQIDTDSPRALDVACGAGRNALFLSGMGFEVVAVDVSAVALERGSARALEQGRSVHWYQHDLDSGLPITSPFDLGFDLIIVVRYADIALVQRLTERLAPGGMLLVEAHLGGCVLHEATQPIGGPSGERFRLAPGALAASCVDLETLFVNEGLVTDPDGTLMALSQIVARKST